MRTRISVALNGTELTSIDSAIVLQGVDEGAASWNITAGNRAGNPGQHVTSVEKRYRDVIVSFAIAEKRDLIRRSTIIQKVCEWAAAGGDLTVNYRDRQKLRVICAQMPAVKTLTKWAETYSITFRAYAVPFWQSMDPESKTISAGTSGSATLAVKESAGGKLCFEATNSSGSTVNSVNIVVVNGTGMAFASLGLANGEKLIGDYDENDIQRLRIKNTNNVYRSVLDKRTIFSADDIMLKCGANTVSVSSEAALSWNVWTYGRWE
jgi:hypothetical protein